MHSAPIKHAFHYVSFQLDGDVELKESDSIYQLCLSWDLPAPNATNRKWLSEKLLLHAVMSKCFYFLYFSSSSHLNFSTLVLNTLNALSLDNIQFHYVLKDPQKIKF